MSWTRLKDPVLQQRLIIRSKIISLVREFFVKEGFLEVETPILVPAAGQEPYLNPMKVEFTTPNPSSERRGSESISSPFEGEVRRGYLITSPEYAHKKLLAAGFEKTFEITKAFRSGEHFGGLHNPEFTMIEWYRAQADYTAIMEDVEKMVRFVASHVIASEAKQSHAEVKRSPRSARAGLAMTGSYQGHTIDLSSPWERFTMRQAWGKYAALPNHAKLDDRQVLRDLCLKRGYTVSAADTYDDLFFKIFLTEIEPKLGYPKPTILYDYPASMASLARLKPSPGLRPPSPAERGTIGDSSPRGRGEGGEGQYAERFEVYIAGMELGNAFSELNDAKEQRRRFTEEQELRKKLGKELIPLDEDFLDAVSHMPPSAGIAFGVDRLVMLLTDAKTIEDVLAFPAKNLFDK